MELGITPRDVRDFVLDLPEVAAWPEIVAIFSGNEEQLRADWQLPILACLAAGGTSRMALPGVAAIGCLQSSIILVDDMLDQDPRGDYHTLGAGRTANLALALQAAALLLVDRSDLPASLRAVVCAALSRAALTTAFGQELDVQNLRGEENYWRVVGTKSTPFYGCALQVGALLGGSSPDVARKLYEAGCSLGIFIQIFDDLIDAFEVPANPDWGEGRNNLALLYATTADHPQREHFHGLLARIDGPGVLDEAQRVLISSGAVSYCIYLLIQRYQNARSLVEQSGLAHPDTILDLLDDQVMPVAAWLSSIGFPVPCELARVSL